MKTHPLPSPNKAAPGDRLEAQRRHDMALNALCNADGFFPTAALQKQVSRYRLWIKSYDDTGHEQC